jgi:hypothetical protein
MSRRARLFAKRLLRASNSLNPDADQDSQARTDAIAFLHALASGRREDLKEVVLEITERKEEESQ